MKNDLGLENPLYEDGRFAIYPDDSPDEHQMLVDGKHYVSLVRGTLNSVGHGSDNVVDYVMKQLVETDVSRRDVTKALLRGRIAELEKRLDSEIEENFELQNH